ncbi:uncharacterized protein LOC119444903 [Dermacentor silvarum]|uniref:uncharacterized protein LOC119444903 n=1 Tax=Dermacentor silvarum TaxID=543639 RepID=UPI0021010B45|nr:uncharacterized protein LOC119444903 [Dermacentor silvarum]
MVAGTSSQHVALADLPTADQLKAMGLCDTLIILSDTGQGAQPVSLVSSLEAEGAQQSTCRSFFDANKEHYCHCHCHDYSAIVMTTLQCLHRTRSLSSAWMARLRLWPEVGPTLCCACPTNRSRWRSGPLCRRCLAGPGCRTLRLLQLFATGEAAALVRHSAPIVVSGTPTLATAPGGEMLLVMDSSPVEDSVGLAAKSWFNDSVIATQALLTLEGHK